MNITYVKLVTAALTQNIWDRSTNNDAINLAKTTDSAFVMLEFKTHEIPMEIFKSSPTFFTLAEAKLELAKTEWINDGTALSLPEDTTPALQRTEIVDSTVTYVGEAKSKTVLPEDAAWRIKRISVQGTQTIEEFANGGTYNQIWDNRASLFSIIYKPTKSIVFDGVDEYISAPDSSDWDFAAGDFTINTWLRFNSVANNYYTIINSWGGAGAKSWLIQHERINNRLAFHYSITGTDQFTKYFAWTPLVDTWYNLCVTRQGDDLKAGVDGAQIGVTESITGAIFFNSASSLWFGKQGAGVSYFDGNMYETSFWKGKSLPPATLYDMGKPGNIAALADYASFCTAHWPMGDGDTYPTIIDIKNANNGTMTNMESGDIVEAVK